MISAGVGILGADTDWQDRLQTMALEQACLPSTSRTSPLICWAIGIEANPERCSREEAAPLLDKVISASNGDITGFDLNELAYVLLRLELFSAAPALAERALVTAGTREHFPEKVWSYLGEVDHPYNLSACQDTYGWALCYGGRYTEAANLFSSALQAVPIGSNEWCEVQYHRTHAAFWAGQQDDALQIVRFMAEKAPRNVWTTRAKCIVTTAPTERNLSSATYDVVISFAGEDRVTAESLATRLVERGLSVFYDDYERTSLWGENLYEYLTEVYQNRGRYCVVLVSQHYITKRWTKLEWRAIQARCFREDQAYCLPVRLDNAELPGLLPTTGYLSVLRDGVDGIAKAVQDKLRKPS
jgi:tetratricopeptide (TPR) repeat protein